MPPNEIKNRTVYMLCHTDGGTDIYVGSTSCPLWKRFSHHKYNAGDPSRLKWYGGSKLYKKMREVGVHNWKIVPLITYACNRETINEFEQAWVETTGASLNTVTPFGNNVAQKEYNRRLNKKNKEEKKYYCELCDVACRVKYHLKNISTHSNIPTHGQTPSIKKIAPNFFIPLKGIKNMVVFKHNKILYKKLRREFFNNCLWYQINGCYFEQIPFQETLLSHVFSLCELNPTHKVALIVHGLLKSSFFKEPEHRRGVYKQTYHTHNRQTVHS